MHSFDLWKFLSGLGLFLYGMDVMEKVLKKLSGRSFKRFLRNYTKNLYMAIAGSTLVTALLQSSSVVSLMVLGFVGAGIISFRNALGIIMGSNLGTTLNNWVVATVGFKLNIENYSLPVVAITSLGLFFFQQRKQLYNTLRLFFSLGILFVGLGYMKTAGEGIVQSVNLSAFTAYGNWLFVIIGFVLTTIIQASSATMAITLTAVYTGILAFPAAASVVIGSELGTTIKVVVAGVRGSADKKRVAYSNFFFNLFTCVLSYGLLHWLIWFTRDVAGIRDPLIGLVFFQSLINLVTILCFLPFVNLFSRWIEHRFASGTPADDSYLSRDLPVIPAMAVDALHAEAEKLIAKASAYNLMALDSGEAEEGEGFLHRLRHFARAAGTTTEEYNRLKQTEGDILEYFIRLEIEELEKDDYARINLYINSVRQAIHAAKAVKDIRHNVKEFSESASDLLHGQYLRQRSDWQTFDAELHRLLMIDDRENLFDELKKAMENAFLEQDLHNQSVLEALRKHQVSEVDASTLMNVQREILSARKSLLRAVAYLNLDPAKAYAFEYLPQPET